MELETLERLESLDHPDHQDLAVRLEQLGIRVRRVVQGLQGLQVFLDSVVLLEVLAPRVHPVLLDRRGSLARRDLVDLLDCPEPLEIREVTVLPAVLVQ